MNLPKGGIAFFDSGVGGLTVLSSCQKYFSGGVFYYYGDNARAPYGNRPETEILAYLREAFELFSALEAKAAVIACNTATAVAVEKLRREYPFPIVGAEPSVFPAAKGEGEVFILSTKATYQSERYKSLCARVRARYPEVRLRSYACEKLAGEIEKTLPDLDFSLSEFLPAGNPSAVVLGCTHYIFLKKKIEGFYGCACHDGNEGISKRLVSLVENGNGRLPQPPAPTYPEKKRFFRATRTKKFRLKRVFVDNARFFRLFFLGSGKKKNVKIYEQMFISIKK